MSETLRGYDAWKMSGPWDDERSEEEQEAAAEWESLSEWERQELRLRHTEAGERL